MKVLHISTSDRQGGAAIAAYRLNEALQNEGVYGAQNETYIEGWEKSTSNLLIYKRLCKI